MWTGGTREGPEVPGDHAKALLRCGVSTVHSGTVWGRRLNDTTGLHSDPGGTRGRICPHLRETGVPEGRPGGCRVGWGGGTRDVLPSGWNFTP